MTRTTLRRRPQLSGTLSLAAFLLLATGALAPRCPASVSTDCGPMLLTAPQEGEQQPPEVLDPDAYCTDKCHQEISQREFLHEPAGDGDCTGCHAQPDETKHEFDEIEDASASCTLCHEMELQSVVHEPVADGECVMCHDPHGSSNQSMLRSSTEASLCGMCHDTVIAATKKAHVHGPAASGRCSLCHDPHSAAHPKLLPEEPVEACLGCHEDHATAIDEAETVHVPVEADCGSCHDPHGSDHPAQIKAETRELCLSCHQELAEHIAGAGFVHGALDDQRSCLSCHQAHVSKFPALLDQSVKGNCLSCHTKAMKKAEGKPVEGIGDLLAKAEFPHGPIQEDNCSGCHRPHASTTADLLVEAHPERFYAPYDSDNYKLCFGCHDQKVFETELTDSLTNFRDGNNNLHYLHVSRVKNGRTCRACHETHGSNLAKHLAKTVPFGKWEMPIKFEKTATGGSCAPGCHKPFKYDYAPRLDPGKQ